MRVKLVRTIKVGSNSDNGELSNDDFLNTIYCDYSQSLMTWLHCEGARLTAFEIVHDGLPGTLITDSMASALIVLKDVDVIVVGADRVTANGDTANKIG